MRGRKSIEKAKDFKGSILRLIKELKPFKFLIILSIILATIGSILSICTPNILSNLTDTIKDGLMGNMNINKINRIALLMIILHITSTIFEYIE